MLESRGTLKLKAEVDQIRQDHWTSQAIRDKVAQLADNLEKLKALFAAKNLSKDQDGQFSKLQANHGKVLVELCKALDLDPPIGILFALGNSSEKGDKNDSSKAESTKPALPKDNAGQAESPPKN